MDTKPDGDGRPRGGAVQERREEIIHDFGNLTLLTQPLNSSVSNGSAAQKLGASIDIVPAGKRACPYHFHYVEEEMFIVLEGEGTLRVAGEMLPIREGDIMFIPPGPEYPHQILNTSEKPLKYLSFSINAETEICEYPDSNKYLAYSRSKGPLLEGGRMHRVKDDLDYWDGEA